MPKFFAHSLMLLAATSGTFLWLITPRLTPYTLQLVAVLVLTYAATHWFRKSQRSHVKGYMSSIPLDLTLLTVIILLLVVETGALASPLIFLLYFLLFAVAMLFEIEATLLLTGTLLVFFLIFPGTNLTDIAHLGELLALIMITPLALYTGHQYESILEGNRKSRELAGHLEREETDTLMFLSTNLHQTLTSALDKLSLLIPQAKPARLHADLQMLYQDLRILFRSARELQETIDKETD